jgi:hypothetical protein
MRTRANEQPVEPLPPEWVGACLRPACSTIVDPTIRR